MERPCSMEVVEADHSPSRPLSACGQSSHRRTFRLGLLLGLLVGVAAVVVSCLLTWHFANASAQASSPSPSVWTGKVGVTPLIPTMCNTLFTSSAPMAILVYVDGKPYAVVPDTGSSNFNLASDICGSKCDVHPTYPVPTLQDQTRLGPTFEVKYGTGGATMTVARASLGIGGVTISVGALGAIVNQSAGQDGFNLFPSPTDPLCYNSYAGILGFAYRGQAAGPQAGSTNLTTNGTTVPILDQFTSELGMPNAIAFELCYRYPQPCGPRVDLSTWKPSRTCTMNYNIGNFYLGGYRSSSLASEMKYTPITDEIHYDVELLGIQVCGDKGCVNVTFPDKIGGKTEDDCVCQTPNCSIPLTPQEYCYFTVVDSGSDGIYMNTVKNTKALLEAMRDVRMVVFPNGSDSPDIRNAFYFDRKPVLGAKPSVKSSFSFFFPDMDSVPFAHTLSPGAIFRQTMAGLVQMAVQGNMQAAAAFQSAKFPVLLGTSFMLEKVVFFDRSRRRLGFADVHPARCGAAVNSEDEIDVRGLVVETPGVGCRKGTGSGGGCPQSFRPSH